MANIFQLFTKQPSLLGRLAVIETKIAALEAEHREIRNWFMKCDDCGEHFTHGVEWIECCEADVCDGCFSSNHDPHLSKRDHILDTMEHSSLGEGRR